MSERDDMSYDVHPSTAVGMFTCSYYQGVGSCSGGCYEEPACQADEPEEGWEHYLPADFDLAEHQRRIEERRAAVELERWLAAEKRWMERPVLEHMTSTGVYPINPASPMYAKGTRFAAFHVSDGGTATSWHETEEEARAKLVEHEQSHDRFWSEKLAWKEQGDRTVNDHYGTRPPVVSPFRDVIRVGGVHYVAGHLGVRGGISEGKASAVGSSAGAGWTNPRAPSTRRIPSGTRARSLSPGLIGCRTTQHGCQSHASDAEWLVVTPMTALLTLTTGEGCWAAAMRCSDERPGAVHR